MGDDSPYDIDDYQKNLDAAQVPLAPLDLPYGLGIMEQRISKSSLKETLTKQREGLLLRLSNIEVLLDMIEKNPEHETFLETLRKVR